MCLCCRVGLDSTRGAPLLDVYSCTLPYAPILITRRSVFPFAFYFESIMRACALCVCPFRSSLLSNPKRMKTTDTEIPDNVDLERWLGGLVCTICIALPISGDLLSFSSRDHPCFWLQPSALCLHAQLSVFDALHTCDTSHDFFLLKTFCSFLARCTERGS